MIYCWIVFPHCTFFFFAKFLASVKPISTLKRPSGAPKTSLKRPSGAPKTSQKQTHDAPEAIFAQREFDTSLPAGTQREFDTSLPAGTQREFDTSLSVPSVDMLFYFFSEPLGVDFELPNCLSKPQK